jgi:hypothetical protein
MTMTNQHDADWHIECLSCGHRYYANEQVRAVHNPGKDWEDGSSYCPDCGDPNESSSEYRMHDGGISRGAGGRPFPMTPRERVAWRAGR